MKCASCRKTVSTLDHKDVLFALGKQPKKIYDLLEKALGLSVCATGDDERDEDGNPVTCGTCYTNAFVKAKRELKV